VRSDIVFASVCGGAAIEAVRIYVQADELAAIVELPQSFLGKRLEAIIMPSEEPSEVSKLLRSIRGPVPDNTTTLEDIREERWRAYEDLP